MDQFELLLVVMAQEGAAKPPFGFSVHTLRPGRQVTRSSLLDRDYFLTSVKTDTFVSPSVWRYIWWRWNSKNIAHMPSVRTSSWPFCPAVGLCFDCSTETQSQFPHTSRDLQKGLPQAHEGRWKDKMLCAERKHWQMPILREWKMWQMGRTRSDTIWNVTHRDAPGRTKQQVSRYQRKQYTHKAYYMLFSLLRSVSNWACSNILGFIYNVIH